LLTSTNGERQRDATQPCHARGVFRGAAQRDRERSRVLSQSASATARGEHRPRASVADIIAKGPTSVKSGPSVSIPQGCRALFDRAALLHLRYAVRHPLWSRCTHQVVVEELLHAHLEVLLILLARQVVRLARIREENDL